MSLRNRKQIPVCFYCRRTVIHSGDYMGPRLSKIAPILIETPNGREVRFFDGRSANLENYIKVGYPRRGKNLKDKGLITTEPEIKEDDISSE